MIKGFSAALAEDVKKVRYISENVLVPRAEEVDREAKWPRHAFDALSEAGLFGLTIPEAYGGRGHGLFGLAVVTEELAKGCPSGALCFGMHCVGSTVISAKATEYQRETYLKEIVAGRHITTLALSETGSGAHFYVPETELERDEETFKVTGTKQFVTNAGYAQSYVLSAKVVGAKNAAEPGKFDCLVVDHDTPGLAWFKEWKGFGMRGNSSRSLRLQQVPVPSRNLLGAEGDHTWYIFEVVAPYFLMGMSGAYLGIAQRALDLTIEHLKSRIHSHNGSRLSSVPALQHRLCDMWTSVERTRHLVRDAALSFDNKEPDALPKVLACKAAAGDTVEFVTNQAMTACGGMAYRENSELARLLRDARACHVMSPTTDMLKEWTGKCLLGEPIL